MSISLAPTGGDDTLYLAAALASLQADGGGELHLSGGEFHLAAPLVLPPVPINTRGEGLSTKLKATTAMGAMLSSTPGSLVTGGGLANLILDGAGLAQTNLRICATQFVFSGVRFQDAAVGGVNVVIGDPAAGNSAFECVGRDFWIYNSAAVSVPDENLHVYGSDNTFDNFVAKNARKTHIVVDSAANNTVLRRAHPYCYAPGNLSMPAERGIKLLAGSCLVTDCNIDSTGTIAGIDVLVNGNTIVNCRSVFGNGVSNDQNGIHLAPGVACCLVGTNQLSGYHDYLKTIIWDLPHAANTVVQGNTPYNPTR